MGTTLAFVVFFYFFQYQRKIFKTEKREAEKNEDLKKDLHIQQNVKM